MTEKNLYDIVQDTMRERNFLYRDELHKRFGKTNPFGMKPLKDDEVAWIYDNMSEEDMQYAIEKYGDVEVNSWIQEMETRKMRR